MKDVEQPVTTEERRGVAVEFLDDMELEMPALLDNIDNKTSKDYASLPDRLYLVGKDGKIAYAGGRGPRGFKPDELADAIDQELGGGSKKKAAPQGTPEQMDRRARRVMQLPTVAAVNTDGDDKISAEEIAAAPETLKSLDKDGDGEISAEEMRPARGGRGGERGGRGGRGGGGGRGF